MDLSVKCIHTYIHTLGENMGDSFITWKWGKLFSDVKFRSNKGKRINLTTKKQQLLHEKYNINKIKR